MPGKADLDWDDLRFFLEAARARTLAGAAQALGVEHAVTEQRLTTLERELGGPLVLRGPDALQLTPLGERVLPLVESIERTVSALRQAGSSGSERVRLAVPSGFSPLFVERLDALRALAPEVVLELVSGAGVGDLDRSEADLAVRSAQDDHDELISRRLCTSGWSLYAAPAYLGRRTAPEDLDDLSGHDLIGYDVSLALSPAARWVEARAGQARVVVRSRELTDMLAAARSGAGLALLPCVLADAERGLVRLTPRVLATRMLSLVYRREMRQSAAVTAVIQFVIDVMREGAARIAGEAVDPVPLRGGEALGA
jgi:DNA-binding transcriptional LysR family regulator